MYFLKRFFLLIIIFNVNALSCENANFIEEKLKAYNLYVEKRPMRYKYKTEVISNNLDDGFPLDPEIEGFAKSQNLRLNHSIFFDSEFIVNSKKVREYQLKPKYFKHNVGQLLDVKTEDGQVIHCTYFNRESDKLLVVGEGFTNDREVMSPFVDMFADHDIVLFDYRGHGYQEASISNPSTWFLSPTKIFFGADLNKAMMGYVEEKDVFAVVDTLKKRKKYAQVNGFGLCYSALIFVKAAAIRENNPEHGKLFDKLILDGCWFSLENFVEKLKEDPKRICSPQYGGWDQSWLVKQHWFRNFIESVGQSLFEVKFNKVSILDYLPKIKNTPILFFYGKDDLTVSRNEFEIIWNITKTNEKTGIITSNPHVRNHLKQKELYLMICDLFLELSHENFISCLHDKEFLVRHYASKLKILY